MIVCLERTPSKSVLPHSSVVPIVLASYRNNEYDSALLRQIIVWFLSGDKRTLEYRETQAPYKHVAPMHASDGDSLTPPIGWERQRPDHVQQYKEGYLWTHVILLKQKVDFSRGSGEFITGHTTGGIL